MDKTTPIWASSITKEVPAITEERQADTRIGNGVGHHTDIEDGLDPHLGCEPNAPGACRIYPWLPGR